MRRWSWTRLGTIVAALALLGLGWLGVALAPAADNNDKEQDADRAERLAAGTMAFRENCLMCHAEEMTSRLRLSDKQWAAEVDKMIGWGAPVPPDRKPMLLEYLVNAYSGPGAAPVAPPARMAPAVALADAHAEPPAQMTGDVAHGAVLYVQNCATCHGTDAHGGDLGTSLVEKPVLLQPAGFAAVVRQGLRRMPGFTAALKPENEADILAWLRTRRFEATGP